MGDVQKPEITAWSENHPVMQYVSVHDVAIERASRIDPGDLTVIAASKQTPLIVASDRPKWVMLTFDLDSSDFPFHVGFPVFIENVLCVVQPRTTGDKAVPRRRGCSAAQCTDPNDRRQNDSVRTAIGQNRFSRHPTRDSIPPRRAMTGFMSQSISQTRRSRMSIGRSSRRTAALPKNISGYAANSGFTCWWLRWCWSASSGLPIIEG